MTNLNDMYSNIKQDIKKPIDIINDKLKSPFWLTYILWWFVFNYDFLLILFGFENKLIAIKTYYHYPKCGDNFCPSLLYYIWQSNWASSVSFIVYDIVLPFALTTGMLKWVYPNCIRPLENIYHNHKLFSLNKISDYEKFVGENPEVISKIIDSHEKIMRQEEYERMMKHKKDEHYTQAIEDDIPF